MPINQKGLRNRSRNGFFETSTSFTPAFFFFSFTFQFRRAQNNSTGRRMNFTILHSFLDRRLLPAFESLLRFVARPRFCTASTLYGMTGLALLSQPRTSLTFSDLPTSPPRRLQLHLRMGSTHLDGNLDAAVGGKTDNPVHG